MENKTAWGKILKFSLPMTLIGIFDLVLIWIDFMWIYTMIGDSNALAAVRVSSSLIVLIEAVLVGVVSSLLVYISQNTGAGKVKESKRGIRGVFSFVIYSGLIVTLLGLLFMPLLIRLYGVNAATGDYLRDYLGVYLIGYVFMSLNNLLLMLPRYFQKLKLIYQGLAIAAVVNTAATPLFMLLFKQQGYSMIAGAAAGTVIANLCCAVYLFWRIFLKDYLKIGLSRLDATLRLDYKLLLENKAYIGSQIFNGLTFNISSFLYILILSYYPSEAFNVYAVASYVFMFFGIIAQNFSASMIPMVANHVGAKQYEEIRELVKKMVLILFCYGLSIAAAVMVAHGLISRALAAESDMAPLISQYLLFTSIPWAMNLVSIVFIFVVAGSGDSKGSMRLTITNMYIIVILCLLTVPHLFTNLTTGVFFTMGLIQALTFFTSFGYYLLGRWTKASLVKQQAEVVEA